MNAAERLECAVAAICPDLQRRVVEVQAEPDERLLWRELSCCILSSQVPYSLSVAAANAVDKEGLLYTLSIDDVADKIAAILRTPLPVDGKHRTYRFHTSKAAQLAATRHSVTKAHGTLHALVDHFTDPFVARAWFVNNAPGAGPKQTSMFLRNSGLSYDLAVLDRHVLDYMSVVGLSCGKDKNVSDLKNYHALEERLRSYAVRFGIAVGLLDWAIWIVMRVFKSTPSEQVYA
ncbi:DNA lyase [Rhizobium leguminosarum]|uniref:8-oxoguanine DNA glycosylase n=1 Tax=Rhizobium leguminosarum TaxID=384 RepID=UPI001C953035|nr:DNA lyase [Rhizobium leguminosarum]MBY5523560.1 DNA lyase [Rhizobium leguminosarum]